MKMMAKAAERLDLEKAPAVARTSASDAQPKTTPAVRNTCAPAVRSNKTRCAYDAGGMAALLRRMEEPPPMELSEGTVRSWKRDV